MIQIGLPYYPFKVASPLRRVSAGTSRRKHCGKLNTLFDVRITGNSFLFRVLKEEFRIWLREKLPSDASLEYTPPYEETFNSEVGIIMIVEKSIIFDQQVWDCPSNSKDLIWDIIRYSRELYIGVKEEPKSSYIESIGNRNIGNKRLILELREIYVWREQLSRKHVEVRAIIVPEKSINSRPMGKDRRGARK